MCIVLEVCWYVYSVRGVLVILILLVTCSPGSPTCPIPADAAQVPCRNCRHGPVD